jgi:hypothetical protein
MDYYYTYSSSKQNMLPILRSIANCSYLFLITSLSCQPMSSDATLFWQMLWYLLHLACCSVRICRSSEELRTLLSSWYFHIRCISREWTVNFIACCSFAFCLAKYLAVDSSCEDAFLAASQAVSTYRSKYLVDRSNILSPPHIISIFRPRIWREYDKVWLTILVIVFTIPDKSTLSRL